MKLSVMLNSIAKIRAIIILLLIIAIIAFYIFGVQNSNIQLFPFDSIRWGEVSSWISLIITAISIAFIFSTFKLQQKLSFLEDRKYRFALLPDPELMVGKNKPVNQDYETFKKIDNNNTIEDKFALRLRLGSNFFVNAQLLTADGKTVLAKKSKHNKLDGTYFIDAEQSFFSGQPVKPLDNKQKNEPGAYQRLILRIEDRDNVFSDIHFRIRLLVKKSKNGKAEAAIDKLTKLQYHLAVGVNKKSPNA